MKTIREESIGRATLRLVETGTGYAGVILYDGKLKARVDGDGPDEVWDKLRAEAAKSSPDYFGFDGARNRFLTFFPGGFTSEEYMGQERNYKIEAKEMLDDTVPLEAARSGTGLGDAIRTVFNKTNLLSPFELVRLKDVLSGDQADPFVRGAAKMASGEIEEGLREMEQALKPHDVAKWTAVTYLPFLWRPTDHMYLKPEITKDFSERVGHSFHNNYETQLKAEVYESLLDLADTTAAEISTLGPQDRVDVQSFMWIVGAYDLERDMPGRE